MRILAALLLCLSGCAASEPVPEATSLLGKPLYRPDFPGDRLDALEGDLAEARANFETNADDVDALIWVGRRLGYLWRYREAIEVYSEGIERWPDEPKLYRHRGHRSISVRDFDAALADLRRAAELIAGTEDEVEPDGQPNAAGIPTSTLHTNVYYHLGLVHYLRGEFEEALAAYERCLAASNNDDMRVATLDWLYMTLRRLGRHDDADAAIAGIHAEMELLENFSYHRRLLMYRGELSPDELLEVGPGYDRALTLATQGYGVGNFWLVEGDREAAVEVFEQVVAGDHWAAFGHIAAEADLKRLK